MSPKEFLKTIKGIPNSIANKAKSAKGSAKEELIALKNKIDAQIKAFPITKDDITEDDAKKLFRDIAASIDKANKTLGDSVFSIGPIGKAVKKIEGLFKSAGEKLDYTAFGRKIAEFQEAIEKKKEEKADEKFNTENVRKLDGVLGSVASLLLTFSRFFQLVVAS